MRHSSPSIRSRDETRRRRSSSGGIAIAVVRVVVVRRLVAVVVVVVAAAVGKTEIGIPGPGRQRHVRNPQVVRNDLEADRVDHRPVQAPVSKGPGDPPSDFLNHVRVVLQDAQGPKQQHQIGREQHQLGRHRLPGDRLPGDGRGGRCCCCCCGREPPVDHRKAGQEIRAVQDQSQEGPPQGPHGVVGRIGIGGFFGGVGRCCCRCRCC
mmetsp:Transcript_52952/g.108509  ORF Transcript_52952/g.108509 Transcript_52952/m.108509 type:complete len:208 (+) Transcript_52952:1269-1892(+)